MKSGPATAVAVVVALAVLAGCSSIPRPAGSPSRAPELGEYEGPAQPDLSAVPVGPSRGTSQTEVVGLTRDGVVITDPGSPASLLDADGQVRWSLPRNLRLPGRPGEAMINGAGPIVDTDAGDVIAAASAASACDGELGDCTEQAWQEYGIAAFSAANGALLWSKVLIPAERSDPPSDPGRVSWGVTLVSAAVVVAYVQVGESRDRRTTFGFDPHSGDQLWKLEGVEVEWAGGDGGDRLLGLEVRPGSGGAFDHEGHPVVLDARTGAVTWRWEHLGRWGPVAGALVGDTDRYGIVELRSAEADRQQNVSKFAVVDLPAGVAAPIDKAGVVGEDEGGPFYAWVGSRGDEGWVMSAGLPPGPPGIGRERTGLATLSSAVGGHLWMFEEVSRSTVAYDRTGARRSKELPGRLVAVSEDWVVTRLEDEGSLGIYRLTR
ncbi:hypothetical protein [Microlunatus sp. GCM10028923]|uniref:hypothetical protein n=1 Tax=Microlunatus sp. GCM10028923 TaxID=3273400 RepID=UPI0036103E00